MIQFIQHQRQVLREQKVVKSWENEGRPLPPPHEYKRLLLRKYQKEFKLKTLIETGTFQGDMISACLNYFEEIHSIELAKEYFEKAVTRFSKEKKVKIHFGDSTVELKKLLSEIKQPTLFWLDGHFSAFGTAKGEKDTPIIEELKLIKGFANKHIILIDDARLFNGSNDYPTMDYLFQYLKDLNYKNVKSENDVIIAY